MTRYAIDAPTLLRIVTDELPVSAAHQLVAPHAIRSRALTLLLQQVRAGELAEKDARTLHTRLTELKIRVLGDRVSRWTSFQIAREQGWETTYDAEYLAVARLQADALVTVDEEMAARASGIVPLAPLSALTSPES
jgi:predicted nucleic acid-binding protein